MYLSNFHEYRVSCRQIRKSSETYIIANKTASKRIRSSDHTAYDEIIKISLLKSLTHALYVSNMDICSNSQRKGINIIEHNNPDLNKIMKPSFKRFK